MRFLPLALAVLLAACSGSDRSTNRYPTDGPNSRRAPVIVDGKPVIIDGKPILVDGKTVMARDYDPDGDGKVSICHKGKKTISVGRAATDAHLGHGDYLGACGRPLRYAGFEGRYERAHRKAEGKGKRGRDRDDKDRGKNDEGRGKKKD